MLHPHTELRPVSDGIGLGVIATRPIPRGTVVWVLDELDQRLPPHRVRRLGSGYKLLLERYSYVNAVGEHVLCWDLARWVNHSCAPNVLSSGWEFDVAVLDIAAGEQITNDYGALNLDEGFRCLCGERCCRGRIEPSDFEALADAWDAQVRDAFLAVGRVRQPLWEWVPHKRRVLAAARDPLRLPSVRDHRLRPPMAAPRRASEAGRR